MCECLMKFIHLADCHLASENVFSSDIGDFIRKKNWETFEKILSENKDADFALIAGDLYERSLFTTRDYQRLLKNIKDYGKNVYYVTGNHDYLGLDNEVFFENKPDNLKLFPTNNPDYYEDGNTRIYGISYEDRIFNVDFDYNLELDRNYFNILLIHGVVDEGTSSYLNLELNKLRTMGFDYVALGHIHKPVTIMDNILYAGTTEAKDFSENLDYGYVLYDEGEISRKIVSNLNFQELVLKTSDFEDYDGLVGHIKDSLPDKINFLRLRLIKDSSLEIDKKYLEKSLNLYYLEIEEETDYDLRDLLDIYPDSLLTDFVNISKSYNEDDRIIKRAKELAIDAILRSRYE